MPQKPLIKGKKIEKKSAANKHGKGANVTKKGRLDKPPRNARAAAVYNDNKEITKMINANNESNFASKAETAGGRLKALKAPPPVLAPKASKKGKSAGGEPDADAEMQD